MTREELQKKRQILCSWSWFYSNSKANLIATRYHSMQVVGKDGEYTLVDVLISDQANKHYYKPIFHSQRFKEDRIASDKISLEINKKQLELNKFYKN